MFFTDPVEYSFLVMNASDHGSKLSAGKRPCNTTFVVEDPIWRQPGAHKKPPDTGGFFIQLLLMNS